jgi:hypothetical protein
MRKSYHLSPQDVKEIIKDYFSNKGEVVERCDFSIKKCGPEWCLSHQFYEAVVYIKDTKIEEK